MISEFGALCVLIKRRGERKEKIEYVSVYVLY